MSLIALDDGALITLTREHLLPRLARGHQDATKPVRIWSMGCQAGDEALLLLLRLIRAQSDVALPIVPLRFTIFATDSDAEAVQAARTLASSDHLQERASLAPHRDFLEASQHGLTLPRDLRESLVFGKHDPLIHPPFAHLELMVCAQSLAAYTKPQQHEFLERWAYGLLPHGMLLLLVPTTAAPNARLYLRQEVNVVKEGYEGQEGHAALLYERSMVSVAEARGSLIERPWISSALLSGNRPASQNPDVDTTALVEELQATLEEQLVHVQELEEALHIAQRAEGAEQRLAAIVASSDDAILSKDLDGVVTSWNAAAERLYGYRAEEMIGQPIKRLYPPEIVEEYHHNMARIRQGKRVEHYETLRLRRDGTRVPVSVTISPIKNYAGATIGASTIARDTSARYALERQREAFLSLVTHELKTPLTTAYLNVQLAQRRQTRLLTSLAQLDNEQQGIAVDVLSLLERTQQPLRVQQRLVDDLLDLARLEDGKLEIRLEVCNLAELVTQTVQDQQVAHPTRLISLELPEADPILVSADPDRLQQALGNYLTNALKFSLETEPVRVGVTLEANTGDTGDERHTARVWVQDFGPGLSAEQQAQIWDQYYQTPIPVQSGWKPGLGLGLYICQQLIQQQGGQVGVASQPGHGATFWFSLPIAHPTAPA